MQIEWTQLGAGGLIVGGVGYLLQIILPRVIKNKNGDSRHPSAEEIAFWQSKIQEAQKQAINDTMIPVLNSQTKLLERQTEILDSVRFTNEKILNTLPYMCKAQNSRSIGT